MRKNYETLLAEKRQRFVESLELTGHIKGDITCTGAVIVKYNGKFRIEHIEGTTGHAMIEFNSLINAYNIDNVLI